MGERVAVAAELLRDDRSPQRELVVTEHALACAEVAVDEIGGRPVPEPVCERATRVERIDVSRIFDQREIVCARGLAELAELLGESRDLEPCGGTLFGNRGASGPQRRELGERGEIAAESVRAREDAERSAIAGLAAPELMSECERGIGVAGVLRLVELLREIRSRGRVVDRGPTPRGGCEQRGAIGGTCRARGLLVELGGLGVAADRLVAPGERRARGGDRRIERERLLEVDLCLIRIVEPLLVDQRELEVEGAAVARMRGDRDLAIQQRRDQRPLAADHRRGAELIGNLRIRGRAGVRFLEAAIGLGVAAERVTIKLGAAPPQDRARSSPRRRVRAGGRSPRTRR